ncbi:type II CAAX endopeptidase family protein [Brevibacillus laterosporus]|uniref:CPBP family intramembrane glutamic endopeptidase n=1 Tax=Brevibacillus laterosporus TaxID=1465 RepID=UPI003D228F9B
MKGEFDWGKEMINFLSETIKRVVVFITIFLVAGLFLQDIEEYSFYICLIIASLLTYILFDRNKWSLGLNSSNLIYNVANGFAGGFLSIVSVFFIVLFFKGHKIDGFTFDVKALIVWTVYCIITALGEEIVARGCIYGFLKYKFGVIASAIVSSGLFALFHLFRSGINAFVILTLFLAGLMYTYMKEKSGAIWLPFGFHFSWNYISGIMGMWRDKMIVLKTDISQYSLINGGVYGIEGSIFTVMLYLSIVIIILIKHLQPNHLRFQMKR